ncbi:hypothetical protein HZA97_00060 [Candidatus Woesearchaeota archaeon]|nr:hypothetical protein [Candidatus Woesearchaeota archaeon]
MGEETTVLKELENKQHVVVSCSASEYAKFMDVLINKISKNFKKICFITVSKPASVLLKDFQNKGMDTSKYLFIDCTPGKSIKVKEATNIVYLPSPTSLTELAITLSYSEKVDLVIIDSLSSLLMYNTAFILIKFLHSVISMNKSVKTKILLTILSEDLNGIMLDLALFCDAIIKV